MTTYDVAYCCSAACIHGMDVGSPGAFKAELMRHMNGLKDKKVVLAITAGQKAACDLLQEMGFEAVGPFVNPAHYSPKQVRLWWAHPPTFLERNKNTPIPPEPTDQLKLLAKRVRAKGFKAAADWLEKAEVGKEGVRGNHNNVDLALTWIETPQGREFWRVISYAVDGH